MYRLAEALAVIDLLARHDEPVSFAANSIGNELAAAAPPRPATTLLVGGAGPGRTLPLTARHADAWNTGGRSPAAFREASTLLTS
jgi:alkanesulfonate monooxygenase SsuD/methylene tetrahydromethanopterin reductase-like flavin-dependent oxidoreductase (luciferase family)